MSRKWLAVFAALLLGGSTSVAAQKDLGGGWKEKTNNEGKVVQELKIEAPAMTEEDQYGYVMPDRYRCDSCRAVMFHLDQELRKKHPKSRRMKEWEYTEVLDETCKGAFQGYGIKLVNGRNALSGPGLRQAEELAPGSGAIQMGGETWSKRLGEICRRIVYEQVGEDEVYDMFYKGLRGAESSDEPQRGLTEALCMDELKECVRETLGPEAPPKAEKSEKAKAKKDKSSKSKNQAGRTADAKARSPPASKSAATSPATESSASKAKAADEKMDVQAFMRTLAVRHGLTSDEYLASRSMADWERLTVAIAGRIFNRLATSEADESCRAGNFGSA